MSTNVFEVTKAGYSIQAEVTVIGNDLLIALTGGDTPHIGTITWWNQTGDSDTTRFPSHHGRFHKDDVLSEVLLKQLKPLLPGTCVITAGVHINGITQEQITASFSMAEELGKRIASWLKDYDFQTKKPVYEHFNHTFES